MTQQPTQRTQITAATELRRYCFKSSKRRPTTTTTTPTAPSTVDPVALEIVPLESVLNFRRALPGTNLPIYRCAAFDNASANDVVSLQSISTIIDLRNTDEIVKGTISHHFSTSRTVTFLPHNLTLSVLPL